MIFEGSKILSDINLSGINGSFAFLSTITNAIIEQIVSVTSEPRTIPSNDVNLLDSLFMLAKYVKVNKKAEIDKARRYCSLNINLMSGFFIT